MKKILFVVGTRPELIKVWPVYEAFREYPQFECEVWATGQHVELLSDTADSLGLRISKRLVVPNHSRSQIASMVGEMIMAVSQSLIGFSPDLIVVHGDTASTLAASHAAFMAKIPVAHVEAGLRSGSNEHPFPEEINRKIVAVIAKLHLAPTDKARLNLLAEGISADSISVTGNTGIDSLRMGVEKLESDRKLGILADQYFVNSGHCSTIVVTLHRRESFGSEFEEFRKAVEYILNIDSRFNFLVVRHANPMAQERQNLIFGSVKSERVRFIAPQSYLNFVSILTCAAAVITDSGGIQEEAPSLGIKVFVARDFTERTEEMMGVRPDLEPSLIGADGSSLRQSFDAWYSSMCESRSNVGSGSGRRFRSSAYGDGYASFRIVERCKKLLGVV